MLALTSLCKEYDPTSEKQATYGTNLYVDKTGHSRNKRGTQAAPFPKF